MTRPLLRIVWAANVVLLALLFGLWFSGQAERSLAPGAGGWPRWLAMSRAEQLAYIQQYRQLQRSPDAGTVLRRARVFARLTADEQTRLRSVARLLRSTIQDQPPALRRDLLRAPEGARAYRVYGLLQGSGGDAPATQSQPAAP